VIDLLSPEGLQVIEEIGREPSIIAFDFDGTLAPIVDEPDDAQMTDQTRALLRGLAVGFPCAVISGRSRADVLERIGRVPLVAVFGNHGVEASADPPSPDLKARVAAWAEEIRAVTTPGEVQIEDKGHSLAVHYRRARRPEEEASRVRALARGFPGARLLEGHAALNVVPLEAPGKDGAVRALGRLFPGRPLLFLGDDVVDEDAFRCPQVTWPVRVGHTRNTDAGYFLGKQRDVDQLLQALLAARARAEASRLEAPPQGSSRRG
jgi:trehalose 6-phosphate phosphatase